MKYLFLLILLFTAYLRAQEDSKISILQNIDTMHPDLSKSTCSSPEGTMLELDLVNFDYNYLFTNGYCYSGNTTTSTTTKCFTFIATATSIVLDAGYTESCNNNTFGPFRLYNSGTCTLVTSSLSPNSLIIGQSYTWCVTMRAYGGGCNGYTTFCPYFTPSVLLPLEFIDFKGTCTNLYWQTANEDNTSYFSIEKSYDGNKWELIGTEQAMGYTTVLTTYNYEIPYRIGITYYQLWEHDFNGKLVMLKRIAIDCPDTREIEDIVDASGRSIGKKVPSSKGVYIIRYTDGTIQKIIN
jgi:hypothetical protein